jgi:catechol 2,3-dioxygenase-like lactoylglutathione lyase family enzyme
MRTFRDAKTMAKALRAEMLARRQVELGHSECLEIVSRQFGLDNWNVLAARIEQLAHIHGDGATGPQSARVTTVPVLRIFSVDAALRFYVDFLGCSLDFGGPAEGEGTPFYGQVSRGRTTLHLTEVAYDASPGSTVFIWMTGLDDLHSELNRRRETVKVWGPAIWVPSPEEVPWGARAMTIADPFGNHLRFNEPVDPADRDLPRW